MRVTEILLRHLQIAISKITWLRRRAKTSEDDVKIKHTSIKHNRWVRLAAGFASAMMVIHRGGDDTGARGAYEYHHEVSLHNILLYDNKFTVADFGLARVAEKDTDIGCKLSYWSPLHVETQEDRTGSYRAPEYRS